MIFISEMTQTYKCHAWTQQDKDWRTYTGKGEKGSERGRERECESESERKTLSLTFTLTLPLPSSRLVSTPHMVFQPSTF